MAGDLVQLVNGVHTLSGGTRQEVKNWRPWDAAIYQPQEACPFCNLDPKREVYYPGPGWMVLQNALTPFKRHELLLPMECWDDVALRSLGGKENLYQALRHGLNRIATSPDSAFPTQFYTHIGSLAGQNWRHHHWHICWPAIDPEPVLPELAVPNCQIFHRSEVFDVAVYGNYAGQTWIYPRNPKVNTAMGLLRNESWVGCLVDEIMQVVYLFNRKFRYPDNESGRGPDYCLGLCLQSKEDWFVVYTPKLNNWGGSEIFASICKTPYVLPWSHANTVTYLKS